MQRVFVFGLDKHALIILLHLSNNQFLTKIPQQSHTALVEIKKYNKKRAEEKLFKPLEANHCIYFAKLRLIIFRRLDFAKRINNLFK